MKTLCVLGCTGQLGSYLVDIGLEAGYRVIGVKRRSSTNNLWRIAHVDSPHFTLIEGDITDPFSMLGIFSNYYIDYCVNTAAQSHVHTSFNEPVHTLDVTGKAVVNILEAIRRVSPHTSFVQMSSSEQFGSNQDQYGMQSEETPFMANSPYAAAKIYAHQMTNLYRECYDLHCSCAIAFNFESSRRGEEFVTRKITQYIGRLKKLGFAKVGKLKLGNTHSWRDWSYAGDTAGGVFILLHSSKAGNYCFSSQQCNRVQDFVELAFSLADLDWHEYVDIDPFLFRPKEVPLLHGNSTRARTELVWEPQVKFEQLVEMMVRADIER